jgi:molybdenum cofactor cytidylyltransferase
VNPSPSPFPLSAIILAAGASSRMKSGLGAHKLFLQFPNGKTVLQTTLERYSALPFAEILLVVPEQDFFLTTHFPRVRIVVNPEAESGMASSLQSGVNAASETSIGYCIALADMPFVRSETLVMLCEKFLDKARMDKSSSDAICVPSCEGKRGNPVIIGATHKQDLMRLQGDTGAKSVLQRFSDNVISVETRDDGVLRDIDTKEDWEQQSFRPTVTRPLPTSS